MVNMVKSKVSSRLKEARLRSGMSREKVAEKIFVTAQAVYYWETGRTAMTIDTISKLAEIYEVSACWLAFGE